MILETLLSLIFPLICIGCKQEGTPLCTRCISAIPRNIPHCIICEEETMDGSTCAPCKEKTRISFVNAPFEFKKNSLMQKAITELKYYGKTTLIRALTKHITIPRNTKKWILTAIPLHPKKEAKRGFNQAEKIARQISKLHSIPYLTLLTKKHVTKSQALYSKQKRTTEKYFVGKAPPYNTTIVIVDDIITTGATIEAAAKAIQRDTKNPLTFGALCIAQTRRLRPSY